MRWLNLTFLARYAKVRFQIQNETHLQNYIKAHFCEKDSSLVLNLPVDVRRVSLTNLSMYNTEYSVFKYIRELEDDVVFSNAFNQQKVYIELIKNQEAAAYTKKIDNETFLLAVHTGLINKLSDFFVNSTFISDHLKRYKVITKINEQFLKAYVSEMAIKLLILHQLGHIYRGHFSLLNTREARIEEFQNTGVTLEKPIDFDADAFAGEWLFKEFLQRFKLVMDSGFFDVAEEDVFQELLELLVSAVFATSCLLENDVTDSSADFGRGVAKTFCIIEQIKNGLETEGRKLADDSQLYAVLSACIPSLHSLKIVQNDLNLYQEQEKWLQKTFPALKTFQKNNQ